jgi:DNA-binding XRE family transcriptional regulator
VLNWEKDRYEPPVKAMPAVLQFLGYDPYPAPVTLSERMRAKRRAMGWKITEAAAQLGIDPATWGEWERTGRIPWRRYVRMLEAFLSR